MSVNIGNKKCKLYIGTKKIRKGYIGTKKIYSCGNIVTYHVDTGVIYQEEVDENESCLSPKTFTPAKSGWEFAGWRQDNTASGSVLSSLVMGDTPVTLYAVFRQSITLTTVANGTTTRTNGMRYWTSAGYINPTFTVSNPSKSGAAFIGWSSGAASTTVTNSDITNLTLTESTTRWALFKYADSSISSRPQYYNSGQGNAADGPVTIDSIYPLYNNPESGAATYIDCSAYSAITISNLSGSVWTQHRGDTAELYFKVGQNTAALATSINGWGEADATKVEVPFSDTKTITLNQADGNVPLTVRAVVTGGYAGGYLWGFNIKEGFTIALTGRTAIG